MFNGRYTYMWISQKIIHSPAAAQSVAVTRWPQWPIAPIRSVRNFSTIFVLLGSTPAKKKKKCIYIYKRLSPCFAIQTSDIHMQIHFRCSGQSVFREPSATSNSGTRKAQITGTAASYAHRASASSQHWHRWHMPAALYQYKHQQLLTRSTRYS